MQEYEKYLLNCLLKYFVLEDSILQILLFSNF
nr:MAG TPA: hypothetical protein [Caudoviricetes sp.]